MYPGDHNSLSLKIFHINPYYSKILMWSTLQLHCFHRSEGEGYPGYQVQTGRIPDTLGVPGRHHRRESSSAIKGHTAWCALRCCST